MKKINLKGIFETLSEKELKNVMGGSGTTNCTTIGQPCGNGCRCSRNAVVYLNWECHC